MSCGIGRRPGMDPAFLWLWHRPAAVAPIQPLAWELPYALAVALKKKKKKCCHDLNIHVEQAAGSPASMQGSSEEKKRILISTSELWPIAHLEGNPHGGESSAGTLNPSTPQSGPYGMKFLCKIPCEWDGVSHSFQFYTLWFHNSSRSFPWHPQNWDHSEEKSGTPPRCSGLFWSRAALCLQAAGKGSLLAWKIREGLNLQGEYMHMGFLVKG